MQRASATRRASTTDFDLVALGGASSPLAGVYNLTTPQRANDMRRGTGTRKPMVVTSS